MSRELEVNGAVLVVDDSGGEDLTPIITLHGAPGMGNRANDWEVWSNLKNEYRIVSYDQRGSGSSSDTPPFTHEQFCNDLDELRRQLGIDEFILTGGSYGGMLAQEYVLRHQENVLALVLRDTAASNNFKGDSVGVALASGHPMDEAGLKRLFAGETKSDDDFRDLIRMIMPLYTVTPDPEGDARKVAAMQIHHATHNFAFSVNQPSYDVSARLGEIRVPTLVTVGRHDWITPVAASEEITAGIPDAELVVFEHSGHGPQNEERDLWLKTVREFLARVVPR